MSANNAVDRAPVVWALGWLCALVSILAILAAIPFVGMGVNDDFSYTQIALKLAETGKLIYNGWNTPMIGLQAYWGALFIKLFGFSFDVVRLSTLPFVAGCALLLYYLLRRAGATTFVACLATCVVMLSPLAIPLEASFMTDIPALFFLLLCFVAALRAIDSIESPAVWFWLCLLAAAGIVGGTVRQIVWLAPVFLFPLIALRLKSLAALVGVGFLWVASLIAAVKFSAWFSSQPYSVALSLIPTTRATVRAIAINIAGMYLEGSILSIPFLSLYASRFQTLTSRTKFLILAIAIGLPAAMVVITFVHPTSNLLAFDYFDGNIITKNGILASNVEAIGQKPVVVPLLLQALLIALALATQLIAAILVLSHLKQIMIVPAKNAIGWILAWLRAKDDSAVLTQILLIFTIPYLGTVFSRAIQSLAIDRYLLPVLVIEVLLLCTLKPMNLQLSPKLAVCLLAAFTLYGIATTHDYFACSRARLTAANELLKHRVEDAQITAGLEFDGWNEIALAGYINDARITIPAKAYIPTDGRKYPLATPYWFWSYTPALEPKYFVVLSPQKQLAASEIPPVPYSTWLPPFHRDVFVQTAPDSPARAFSITNH